jgi:hypothetical protein
MFITSANGAEVPLRKCVNKKMIETVLKPDEGFEIDDNVGQSLIKANPRLYKEFITEIENPEPETAPVEETTPIEELPTVEETLPVEETVAENATVEETVTETYDLPENPPTKEELENEELYPTKRLFQLLEGMGETADKRTGRKKLIEKILAKLTEDKAE